MDLIELRGLTFYGYHGAFPEERTLGQRFVVDLRIWLDLAPAGLADDLNLTADYGLVAETVRDLVEGEPVSLVEALAERIARRVLHDFPMIQRAGVRIEKPSAPVKASPAGLVAVEIVRDRAASDPGPTDITHGAENVGSGVLSASTIRALCARTPPLVDGMTDPDLQIQPNGVDLTLGAVWRLDGQGALGWANDERVLASRQVVDPSLDGWFELGPGPYLIMFREIVSLPRDLMALGRPRSSLCRCGASMHTAIWDAGYSGRSEALLMVYAERGLRVRQGARVLQLVFVRLDRQTAGYNGAYQRENLA